MDAAWAFGLSHFDTADAYGGGRSEADDRRLDQIPRRPPDADDEDVQPDGRGRRPRPRARSGSPASSSTSLERLGVDHVDLYLAHDFDPDVPLAPRSATFEELRGAGKIRAYGVSNFDAEQLATAARGGRAAGGAELLLAARAAATARTAACCRVCAEQRVSYLVFSPLAGGWLTGKYRRDQPFPPGRG